MFYKTHGFFIQQSIQGIFPGGPIASNVEITGVFEVGETLTASYDYYDPNGNPESGSIRQWYRSDDDATWIAIPGANALTYELTENEFFMYVRFGVIPSDGSNFGAEAFSDSGFVDWIDGAAGFYGDTSVFANNFTTAAGSTNATQAGDPLGRIVRLQGSLNLTQGTDANRPTLARSPRSGIRNRLTYSEDCSNAAWSKTDTTVTGTQTLTQGGAGTAIVNRVAGAPITAGAICSATWRFVAVSDAQWVRTRIIDQTGAEAVNVWFDILNGVVGTTSTTGAATLVSASISELDGGGYECIVTGDMPAGSTSVAPPFFVVTADGGLTRVSGAVYRCIGVQLETGSPTAYQKVTAAWDVTESGQPDIWLPWFDGSNDYMTTGVQSFGTASLFADAGQAWTVFGVFRTVASPASGNTIIGKAGTTAGNRTLQVLTASTGVFQVFARGTSYTGATALNDGVFHTWVLHWSGAALRLRIDTGAWVSLTVGTASEEAETILVGARTVASPVAPFSGRNLVDMIDRALTDAEVTQLMAYLNNTYRYGL